MKMMNKIDVLDHGHVILIDKMGDDSAILQAARTSYQQGTKKVSSDRDLLRYLMRHEHQSPFESVMMKFHIKLPIFVERQFARHRTAGWNEVSARYSVLPEEYYCPDPENVKAQSLTNKQGRGGDLLEFAVDRFINNVRETGSGCFSEYKEDLERGVSRELARINLPVSTYTEKVWWCNLRNIFHFLGLRMDSHAQWEIRQYANAMYELIKPIVPLACESFEDYVLHSKKFSRMEMEVLQQALGVYDSKLGKIVHNENTSEQFDKPSSMTDREWVEFVGKLS
jgi:thymidylate synthase (FAD)